MWSITTTPKFAIGQRCILLQTSAGNVLWDCVTFLDQETVQFIHAKGGLKAIVISHPHYYATHLDWAETFQCPVYLAAEDEEWLNREDENEWRRFIRDGTEEIVKGVTAVKVGLLRFLPVLADSLIFLAGWRSFSGEFGAPLGEKAVHS